MKATSKNNQIQVKTLNNSKYNYNKEAEVIHGNAATGEQYSLKRNIYSEVPITPELMERHWDEMDREVENLRKQYPGQAISAASYQDMGGKQIIKFTPTTELIFPSRVPIFDEKGNQIVGKDNIRTEIKRREEEWTRWEKEGKLSEHVEIHHTDDGKTVRIKFRAAPKRNHPNETRSGTEWIINNETQRWENKQSRIGDTENNQEFSEGTLRVPTGTSDSNKVAGGNNKSKKPKVEEEQENTTPMKVDKPENLSENLNSSKGTNFKLSSLSFSDDEIEKASKDKLNSMKKYLEEKLEQINKELEIREKIERSSEADSINYEVSTSELKEKSEKYKNFLDKYQTSNTSTNKDNKSSNGGEVIAIVGVVSALAIGGWLFVKGKVSKNKKK